MGLNTEDWSYELGQGWVADDFDSQIEGASVGDTLTFTTSYGYPGDPVGLAAALTGACRPTGPHSAPGLS